LPENQASRDEWSAR